jgi:predicted RNA-binding Zn-ribbon protein involved in translation (DUF1610 family)
MPATDEIVAEEVLSLQSRQVRHCSKCGQPIITAPALQCPDCGSIRRLRCFVRRAHAYYIAECIDLDISAEAETLEGAISGLQDAMDGYMSVVLDTNTSGVIFRPSPLSHRIRYYIEYAKDMVSAIFSRPRARTETVYEVPAVPMHSRC